MCLLVPLALVAARACATAPVEGMAGKVVRVGERRIPFPDQGAALPEPRVDGVYFDAGSQPRWDDRRVHEQPTGDCDSRSARAAPEERPLHPRRTRLVDPRVDERRCPDPQRRGATRKALVGLDAQGRVRWERPLVFLSGEVPIEQWLIGASREGLVLSSLEVWSPVTGETLIPARTHLSGAPGRPVPDHHFTTSALYLPAQKEMLVFDADVTLRRREGGVYRIDAESGRKELWIGVSASPFGTFDRVESMALGRTGRVVLLGMRRAVRGPSSVSVAVLDLETQARVFEERHGAGHACSAPQVVAGPDGHFAFAYRDDSAREHVLVHYRVLP